MTETVEHNGVKLSVCSRNGLVTMIYGKKIADKDHIRGCAETPSRDVEDKG